MKRSLSGGTVEADQPLPTRQGRSRATTERLLAAAEDLLRDGGVEAATLRAIAERAGVSLGIVYRRFRDKDAVLRAVYSHFFDQVAAANARALANARLRDASLEQVATALIRGIAEGYRRQRRLLRALVLYARTHPDRAFRRRAAKLNTKTVADIIRIIDRHGSEISHPLPEIAVPFAVAAVASVLAEAILFDDVSNLPSLSHPRVVQEATRLFLAYLGVG